MKSPTSIARAPSADKERLSRACFEGDFWDGGGWLYGATQVKGDMWGCVGYWYSGNWYDAGANQYIVKINVTRKGDVNDYSWMNTLQQRLELLDDKGGKFQNWGGGWGGGNNSVQMSLTYGHFGAGKVPTPARLVFQNWITKQHEIAFEFRDVPLP